MTPILMQDETVLGFLQECISCVVTEERNGIFELTLSYPVAGSMFKELQIDRILKVKPNDTASLQLFRIYEVEKPMNGIVTVNAEHISYALAGYPVDHINQTCTATQAISAVLSDADRHLRERLSTLDDSDEEGSVFPFRVSTTDMVAIKKFSFVVGSAREALGGKEGSILDVYGGEYEFDNYTIKLHSHRGRDTGIVIGYGKNMTDIKATTSMESCYTGLFPYATKDNKTITAAYSYLDAATMRWKEHLNVCRVENKSGVSERILLKDFSSDFDNDEAFTSKNLAGKADAWLRENDINSPTINVIVSFINLWQSPEYAELEALEKVSLCDAVMIRHQGLGIDMKAQVIKTVYDTLSERYQSIELGSPRANFQDTWKQTTDTLKKLVDTVNPDGISSQITKEYLAAIDSATKKITGAEYGVVKLNPSTYPRELLIMDNASQNEAKNIWRWNVWGLGFSSNGYDGPFTTAITADGAIVADFITAGTLTANIIRAGILKSANGQSYFNLESGVIQTNNARITGGTIKIGSNDYYTYIANGSIAQFAEGNGTLVGGMVPTGSSTTYSQSIYFNGSTCDGLGLSIRSSDGYFTHLIYVSDSAITMRRDTVLYGDLEVFGKVSPIGLLSTGGNIRIGGMVENHLDVEKGIWIRNSSKEEIGGLYDNNGRMDLFYNKAKQSELNIRYSSNDSIFTIARFNDSAIELYKKVTVSEKMRANSLESANGLKLLATESSEYGGLWGQSSATYAYYVPSQSNGFCIASLSGNKFTSVAAFNDKEAIIAGKLYADGYEVQSVERIKDNIAEVESSVLSAFKDSKIYAYNLKTQAPSVAMERSSENASIVEESTGQLMVSAAMERVEPEADSHTQYGFIIGRETPSELISEDGEHIDLYAMAALNWKATQEIIQRLEMLENDHGRDDS